MNDSALPLKPMHLPPEPGIWPLPPGFWLLLVVFGLAMALLIWRWHQKRRQGAPERWLSGQLQAAFRSHTDPSHCAQAVNTLLKRWAIARGAPPSLQGDNWFRYLQAQTPDTGTLPPTVKDFLLVQPYRPKPASAPQALGEVEQALLAYVRRVSRRPGC